MKFQVSLTGLEKEAYGNLRRNCRRRQIPFRLSFKFFRSLISAPCHYCRAIPQNRLYRKGFCFLYQGIDRKANDLGYVPKNLVPCCRRCNSIKGENLSYEEMLRVAQALKP